MTTGTATKFTFGADFREGGRRAVGEADLAAARAEGFRAGEAQARCDAEGQAHALLGVLAGSAERLIAGEAARAAEIEAQAAHVAIVTAQALAGAALADKPLALLEGAARDCLGHARLAPHLVMRVHESAIETVEAMLVRLARETGFAGRIVVLGETDIAPGDGRIEWADGGFAVDAGKLARLVEQAAASVFGQSRPGGAPHEDRS